jgi:2-polyprenyl-6-methoxyphenol hydroxylase-like FAD-dependent oxidoreductase
MLTYPESLPIQRGRLREVLVAEPQRRDIIHFSKTLKNYEVIDHKIKVYFEDGSDAVGDLVIAADGSKSRLNTLTGLSNRYLTDVRCITARIKVTNSDMVGNLPQLLQAGPIMMGLPGKTVCFSSLYLPALDNPTSVYHKSSTLMWALAVDADFWKKNLGYDPEERYNSEKMEQEEELLEAALELTDHWNAPILKSVMAADVVTSIGYGAFRSSHKPNLTWRQDAKRQLGDNAGPERIWFMGDSIHAMTRIFPFDQSNVTAARGMGGNQALFDAAMVAKLLPDMVKNSQGDVIDEQVHEYLVKYEKEMIPRGFKWVAASEEGHDLFNKDHFGGKVKFWMIISIMRVIKYLSLAVSLPTRLFQGPRKALVERVESNVD